MKIFNVLSRCKVLLIAIFSTIIAMSLMFVLAINASAKNVNYVSGKALVCVKGGASALENSSQNSNLQKFSVSESLMTLDSNSKIQEAIANQDGNLNSYLINSESESLKKNANEEACEILSVNCEDTESFVSQVTNLNCVMWAQPDYIYYPDEVDEIDETSANTNATSEINDEYFQYQWAYKSEMLGGKVNLDADKTWNEQEAKGDVAPTVVAVIDTGVDYNHPDLKDNMWSGGLNYPELRALGGGQYGINCVPNEDTTDPMDKINGHGTHCASTIASPFNEIGVRGVNGHDAKIMACRFLGSDGGANSWAIKCFNYIITAKKCGVDVSVISNSWGDSNPSIMPDFSLECITTEAGLNGIVDCFSAGNDSRDLDSYPSRAYLNPYTVVVGASDDWGQSASFSNYGKRNVDVYSPGVRMLNCVSSYKDMPDSKKQYLSWASPAEDSYFHEDFKTGSSKVEVSAFTESTPENVVRATNTNVGTTVDLSSFSEGDNVFIRFEINKTDLQELIDSGAAPYYSALFNFSGIELSETRYSLKYFDGNQHIDLYDNYFGKYNHDFDVSICKLASSDFYKISGDKVNVEMNFIVERNAANSSFTLCDLGFGMKTGIYGYKNGTSMAAPVVSGIASHISPRLSNFNGAKRVLETVAYIKGCTNEVEALQDKSINPGMVNLLNAYDGLSDESNLHPVVESAEITESPTTSGQIVTLHGKFFGNEKGQAGYDNITYAGSSIQEWTDTKVIFHAAISTEHMSECFVIRPDGKKGRNFFKIGSHFLNYENLPTSNFTYEVDDVKYSTKDLNVLRSASTNSNMYVLYGGSYQVSDGLNILESFNYTSQTWKSIDLSMLDIKKSGKPYLYSMASGAEEIYILYLNSNDKFNLATYSEKSNSFLDEVNLDCATYGDMICNYHGQLMLCGRTNLYKANRDFDIVKIYPNTGNIYENFGNFPDFSQENDDTACGNVSVYEDKIYISDCAKYYKTSEGTDEDIVEYSGPVIFDGNSWHRCSDEMISTCEEQFLLSTSSATDKGLISAGITQQKTNGHDDNLYDTWTYDANFDTWKITEYVFSNAKTRSITSICHDNNFYVLGQRSVFGDIAFRYLPLSKVSANSENVVIDVDKEIIPPAPPQPDPPIYTNSQTGDCMLSAALAFLLLASFVFAFSARKIMLN